MKQIYNVGDHFDGEEGGQTGRCVTVSALEITSGINLNWGRGAGIRGMKRSCLSTLCLKCQVPVEHPRGQMSRHLALEA